MTNDDDIIFSKFIQKLNERAEYVGNKMDGGICSDYGFGYLQSLVYQMVLEVPGAAEYLKWQTEQLSKLQEVENGPSELAVPDESL